MLLGGAGLVTAAHLEERDVFCASCHTQPETAFFSRTLTPEAVDLASMHHGRQVKCIDCHSRPGLVGRVGAIGLGIGDLLRFMTATAQQPAPLTVPITDDNCLKCHTDVPQARTFNHHFHHLLPEWQARDSTAATCVSCHSAHTTTGSVALMFLEQEQTTTVCQRCHNFAGVD